MGLLQNIRYGLSDIGRPVLSDRTIMKYNKKGLLVMGNISNTQLQPNSVDLTLANTWKKPTTNFVNVCDGEMDRVIDPSKEIPYEEGEFEECTNRPNEKCRGQYILAPGEFVLMASREVLNIPNGILSFVQGRSSIARIGIQTEQAGLIDAGFRGTITFEVKNETDESIILYEGMRVAQVYFFKSQHALYPYGSRGHNSKYNMQIKATGSRIHVDPELNIK